MPTNSPSAVTTYDGRKLPMREKLIDADGLPGDGRRDDVERIHLNQAALRMRGDAEPIGADDVRGVPSSTPRLDARPVLVHASRHADRPPEAQCDLVGPACSSAERVRKQRGDGRCNRDDETTSHAHAD